MANLVVCGDFSCDDARWTFGTGWSRDAIAQELVADSTASSNIVMYSEWDGIAVGQTLYYSIDFIELGIDDPANWSIFTIGGVDVTPPSSVGTLSGQVVATSNEFFLQMRFDGAITSIRVDNVIVSDTPLDNTAPTLSNSISTATYNSVTIGVTTDEDNGILHCIVVPAEEEFDPTDQEVIDASYVNTVASPSDIVVNAAGEYTFETISGLSESTMYGYVLVHEDAAGNRGRLEGSFNTSAYVPSTIRKESISGASAAEILKGLTSVTINTNPIPSNTSKAIPIYNKYGTLIGYMPVFDNIW